MNILLTFNISSNHIGAHRSVNGRRHPALPPPKCHPCNRIVLSARGAKASGGLIIKCRAYTVSTA